MLDLTEPFLAHLPPGSAPPPRSALAALLEALVAEACAAWPEVAVSAEDFVAYVAQRLSPGEDLAGVLPGLQAADLYLACGCTRGDPAALAGFERQCMARLASYLHQPQALPAFTDEVKQAVRVRLLVPEGGGLLPRIASYRGRGPLAVWLRLAAVRLAVNLRKHEGRGAASSSDVERLQSEAPDPELEFFKTHYREELTRAVEGALAALSVTDANLLRLHFFERLPVDTLAAMNGVSGRTVQRWIAGIRERLVSETRRLLRQRCPMNDAQLDSVVGLVQSQIELSVRRLLGAGDR
jgi:RNA polymerase sigma-70 factor (ECF subfamily)